MNRIRLLAIAMLLCIGLASAAQQNSGNAAPHQPAQGTAASNTEEHLKMLSENLSLTADQQQKLRPIIQDMLDERQRLMHDESLSVEQREAKQRALHEKADREARKFLNVEQQKKLDELEAQHHANSAAHAQP